MTKRKSSRTVHYAAKHTPSPTSVKHKAVRRDTSKSVRGRERVQTVRTTNGLRSSLYIVGSITLLCAILVAQLLSAPVQPTHQNPTKRVSPRQLPQVQKPVSNTTLTSFNVSDCPHGTILNTVAHEDDDILFMNPAIQDAISAGMCVRTVYFTAGDDGSDASYWQERERGPDAAYAKMFNVPNDWTATSATIAGHQVVVHDLTSKPQVSLVFLRLPDGGIEGQGFASNNYESLLKLRNGQITIMHTLDGSSSYNGVQLIDVLRTLMKFDKPVAINTQASGPDLAKGDHSDHQSVGYFTSIAAVTYASSDKLHHYIGYQIGSMDPNLNEAQIKQKAYVFDAYQQYDGMICNASEGCFNSFIYYKYLSRQYEQKF